LLSSPKSVGFYFVAMNRKASEKLWKLFGEELQIPPSRPPALDTKTNLFE